MGEKKRRDGETPKAPKTGGNKTYAKLSWLGIPTQTVQSSTASGYNNAGAVLRKSRKNKTYAKLSRLGVPTQTVQNSTASGYNDAGAVLRKSRELTSLNPGTDIMVRAAWFPT
ncbi:hypothetical protein Cenrod_1808 [Candidatus Symbiobacter mobilis CR]|uniref:Uncharacterized protein n=1 Tax=Candidatus Symbiobacter mobilis CR TaxID=946483 RepID=U5N940_9BURK|nr:hypothetical protein Cenrod_1808 [Candidatus Symbiobacter mobilis CR]